ncbi:MAG: phenylalanine--tRNA ligase subunit beta [Candidatus Diapherotrites archaeon]|nr:phenylalanine--tRNA ligase subunit beta [Candidatus Diapherotrites archaeon]
MPTIECSKKDLEKLIGKKFDSAEKLEQALQYAKGGIGSLEGDALKIEVQDANRPDLWSAEGIARELKARLGLETGLPKFKVKKSKVQLIIEKSVKKSRPYMVAALAKNVKITEEYLVQMIQLQEKVGLTYGRKRKEVGIGIYDLDKMKAPIYYKGIKPREIKFAPLEFERDLGLNEILELHPKGKEYGHLIKAFEYYPIVMDSTGTVCAMPPIINSNYTGKVTEKTKNLFIEVTGWNKEIVNIALNVMVAAVHDRGADIEAVEIVDETEKAKYFTPNFEPKKTKVKIEFINKLAGMNWSTKEIVKLLERARYNCTIKGKEILLEVPSYRQDLLHEADIVEDAVISYGYNNLEPKATEMNVVGKDLLETRLKEVIRSTCVGLQLQEVLTYNLTSKEKQVTKLGLNLQKEIFAEIANPMSSEYAIFRKQIFPELLEFLGKNSRYEYPQNIFEIGKGLELDAKSETGVNEKNKICIIICGRNANFNEGKRHLQALSNSMNWDYELKKIEHSAFKPGLCAEIKIENRIGIIGELKESILKNFSIEMPACVIELEF